LTAALSCSPNKDSNCYFPSNFSGTLNSITVTADYTSTINLGGDVAVASLAQIGGGTITGSGELDIGGHVPLAQISAATLNWTGGVLSGPTTSDVYINSLSTANITGAATHTLDGRRFWNYGTVNWDGSGNILLKNSALFLDYSVMNIDVNANRTTIDGNGENQTGFQVTPGGTLNLDHNTGHCRGPLFLLTRNNKTRRLSVLFSIRLFSPIPVVSGPAAQE
jgi:hypothetical protein